MIDSDQQRVGKWRVLVVDDDEVMREIVVSILGGAGYECREGATGLEALALLESGDIFDVMLTDLLMPGLDGVGLLARAKVEYPQMPVVIASTIRDIEVVIQTFRDGACDYLPIPFEREALLAVVSKALEDQKREREREVYVSKLESQIAELTERLRMRTS